MHHRQAGRRRRREHRLTLAPVGHGTSAIGDIPAELLDAFDELSVGQRAVIYLTYWHDLSVAQVAGALGVTDGTVRRQLARARARLRGALS